MLPGSTTGSRRVVIREEQPKRRPAWTPGARRERAGRRDFIVMMVDGGGLVEERDTA